MNLNTTISPRDGMFQAGGERHYFSVGESALHEIRLALQLANTGSPATILDFPSGHGRVLRRLRVEYPAALITACDIDLDAIRFCADEFGAVPVPGSEDLSRIPLDGDYDLIWCGSLLTHLNADLFKQVLSFMSDHLAASGVLVFTTHGRRPLELFRNKVLSYLGPDHDADFEEMIREYGVHGFSYRNYSHMSNYGISLSKPFWVLRQLELFPKLRLLMTHEAGWDNHQDVFACVKV